MSNTEQFAAILAENLQGVSYDPNRNMGVAYIPSVGNIKFREASNDPAVIIEITHTHRFKGTAETALEFLDRIREAWGNSD